MAVPTSTLPAVGVDARSVSDQKVYNALLELQAILTNGVDTANINTSAAIPASKLVASTLPGYEIGYDTLITASPLSITATTEATGNTVIACAAHTFDGAPVVAHFFSPCIQAGAGGTVNISLFEGATSLGQFCIVGAQNQLIPSSGDLRFTPTAGSHTYTVSAFRTVSNGNIYGYSGGVGQVTPCFIRFTKV